MKKNNWVSNSVDETEKIAQEIIPYLAPGSIVCFHGDLGSGKTTLIKNLVHLLTGTPIHEIQSPTYGYLNEYGDELKVFHFDLYRLRDPEEFTSMGFFEFLEGNGIALIEWPERIASALNLDTYHVQIDYLGDEQREISFT